MVVMYLWMLGLKSEGGVRQGCMSVLLKSDAVSEFSLAIICAIIMGWSVWTWSSARRHDMESVNIENLFLLECSDAFKSQ